MFNALRYTLYAVLFAFPFSGHADPVVKIVNGRVKEVQLREQRLVLSFRRPATGLVEDLVLQIDGQTGFKKGVRLQDFRPDEPVSVDYEEASGSIPRAVQVREVPLRGVPDEIRRF